MIAGGERPLNRPFAFPRRGKTRWDMRRTNMPPGHALEQRRDIDVVDEEYL
jgi:hypothetical protein